MNYLKWNELIAKHFFNEEKAGREVLLYLNESLLGEIGSEYNVGKEDFIGALKIGPPGGTRHGFCQKALQACVDWRSRKLDYPPYIGYLAFFVLADGVDAGFSPQSYYPKFWTLLKEPSNKGTPASFDDMLILWDDLEKWSREDKHETLGRFVARIRGGWWKVGLPRAQTIISEEERKHLPWLFEVANLDSTDPPSPEIMGKLFNIHGSSVFEKKTLRLLQSTEGEFSILKQSLVELVLDELENWDGIITETKEPEVGESVHQRILSSGLRICLNCDVVAQEVKCYLRFKTGKSFPEEGLNFERLNDSKVYSCMETFQGWSTPLKYNEITKLDAVSVDWVEGERFIDKENEWQAKLRGTTTRLFKLGIDNLPDWIESQMLERGIEFYIASCGQDVEKIRNWGAKSCERFKEFKVSGLPYGWSLFYGKNAKESCDDIDILSISSQVRLLLRDGIRAGRGNVFFNFAPPRVIIENGTGDEKVTVNNKPMINKNILDPIWILPDEFLKSEGASIGEPLRIEVNLDGQVLSKIIKLVTFGLPASCEATPFRNKSGEFCSETESCRVRGVCSVDASANVSYPQLLPFYLSNKIIFIGRRPGEIAEWPCGGILLDWQPVWALACKKRNLRTVNFCGTMEDAQIDSNLGQPINDRKKLKSWREALWIQRKVTIGPELTQLKKVWKKYVEAASHV